MLRLQDNPPMVWPTDALDATASETWMAAYCRPRQEKALAWDLRQKGVAYFLPMVMRETSSGGRRRRNLYPLFSSYLFLSGPEEARVAALKTDRIVKTIRPTDGDADKLQQELCALNVALKNFPDTLQVHKRLARGAPARIKSGPMAGLEGVVLDAGSRRKLYLAVTCLGAGATLEIHPDLVEPL